jgi:hypothetical protein
MARWTATVLAVIALPAVCVASPARAPEWVATLDRHADATVDAVLGERGDALLALTGEPARLHGVPVAGLWLTWLNVDGSRTPVEGSPELLAADLSADGQLAAVTLEGRLLVGPPGALESVDLGDCHVTQVRWDPTGERLAVTSWPESVRPWDATRARTLEQYHEALDSDVLLVSPDLGRVRRLTTGSKQDYNPVWSPDGTQILFISLRTGYASFFLADVASGRQRQLTNHGAERGATAVPVSLSDRCRWDAASDRIVYETRSADGGAQVWILDPSGEALTLGSLRDLRAPGDGSAAARNASGWTTFDLAEVAAAGEVVR